MKDLLISNANIVNENEIFTGSVTIRLGKINQIHRGKNTSLHLSDYELIDASGKYLLPGVIDNHVHFREPGLTQKGDIGSESAAAVAGGITSFMEMPNTVPQTTSFILLEKKFNLAARKSLANYSFYFGATNDNFEEIKKVDSLHTCGVKIFMGSSTGNMLVNNRETLEGIFAECPVTIVTHCEDEETIRKNLVSYRGKFSEDIPVKYHPVIRSEEACYKSSSLAVELADKYSSQLHILHVSTKKELKLFDPVPLNPGKHITAESCIHHLWFDDSKYETLGTLIKWNPAVKTKDDREGLLQGLIDNRIDTIATDHAPHTLDEKKNSYFNAPSGGPMVQHALVAMLEFVHQERISIERVVEKMCHNAAILFRIDRRGYVEQGYYADMVLVDMNAGWEVSSDNILYKCGWSPMEGVSFGSKVVKTFVNGHLVYDDGKFDESQKGERLLFNR